MTAISIALLLHAAAFLVGAAIRSSIVVTAASNEEPDVPFAVCVVETTAPVAEVATSAVAYDRSAIPTAFVSGDPLPAIDPDSADDEPPLPAAPAIAVVGGTRGSPRPSEWAPRPSVLRGGIVGHGNGGRRTDARGPGGTGDGVVASISTGKGSPAQVQDPLPRPHVTVAARVVAYVAPRFPDAARRRGLEGVVVVEVDVLEDGSVVEIRVVDSSGVPSLDEAAVRAVRAWRFAAATLDGVPERSTLTLPPIRFRLE